MLMPSIFGEDLFNDWFSFPDFDKKYYGKNTDQVMKTDIKEKDKEYEVDIELPGYKKEDVKAELKDGYLTISAAKNVSTEDKKEDGKYIRKERFSGNVSRSFYVGEDMTQEDIHAKFEDGILKLTVPKKEAKKVEDKKSYITIEG
ncbi:MAG TPA: Hsp20/alpha crystallin family protein [Candidatus Anaerostipes avicola]|uniref:Hsp20/alpha crystallin family protein n=1 Tax=Candidatus Anaerostipes avistercoris TaxID=2838462 RepID=A0A9D2PGA4_9FIRM|nr:MULTISPECIES: Hsp20/alpha crystallin family protein [Anaerostipes]HJC50241.1 Hsp20/alpha crystallin family protein [Candidatus Anaerostipes avistercoris]HJC82464.1 Hsp20/alpha crystallin family protein [Candidatus Anaerostipes avicola]